MNKFQQYGEVMIKKGTLLQYCHGGQYIACSSGRGMNSFLTIINTLTIREIHTFKISFQPTGIVFHENDDELFVKYDSKVISLFKISSQAKV